MNYTPDYITSTNNPTVKMIVSLHSNKGRQEHGLFLAQGTRTITTILESKTIKPYELFATEKEARTAQLLASNYSIDWTLVSDAVMKKISTTESPSGLVLIAHIPKQKEYMGQTGAIVLAQMTDPGNMGTLIRTAAACNIAHVIIIQGADVWNPKVTQASVGSIGLVAIYQLSWEELVTVIPKESLCALVADQAQADIKTVSLKNKILVIGNEAHGIKREWLSDCNTQATIFMKGKTESLNAAVAGSIALYLTTN